METERKKQTDICRKDKQMNIEDVAKCKTIIDTYGTETQQTVLIEGCAELIQAVCKLKRVDPTDAESYGTATKHFIEELADVTVMIEQMKQSLTPALSADYNKIITEKLDRQIKRMEEEKEKYLKWRNGVNA